MAAPKLFAVLAGILAAGASTACGSSQHSEESPRERFARELAHFTCGAMAACCNAQGQTNDHDTCLRIHAAFELQRGEVFDAAAAAECLDALTSYTCDGEYPQVCMHVFSGTVPVGGACQYSSDCARPGGADTLCEWGSLNGDGTCLLAVTSSDGEPCATQTSTETRVCADGLDCSSGVCEARAKAGEDCQGKLCADGECEWDASAPGFRCQPWVQPGGDCSTRTCVESAWCGSDQSCHAKKALGEPCQSDQECSDICHPTTQLCAVESYECF